jgi:hypothetical protein
MIIIYGWKQKRPLPITLLGCALLFVVGSSAIRETRDVDAATRNANYSAAFDLQAATLNTLSQNDNEMFDTMANELLVVPSQVPFRPLCSVTDLLIRGIPRPLYPNKPLECPDAIINTLWPNHYKATRAVQATSIMGNLYADSGVFGVSIGMFAIGFGLSVCWAWFQLDPSSPARLMVYSTVPALAVVLLRGTFPDTAGRSFYILLPIVGFALTAQKKSRSFGTRVV